MDATALRDYFALSHAGGYRPLKDFLQAALSRLLQKLGIAIGDAEQAEVMRSLTALDPAPGARQAVETFPEAGWRIIARLGSATWRRNI